jgi:NADP-dependent 3-hydroxy acid dehydrogenase YdfG
MSARNLTGTTAIVTGASRGFGRATAISLAARGAHVVGVARSAAPLADLREELGDAFTPEVADVADPAVAADLIARYRPQTLVLNAGAAPPVGSIREHTWETFSINWNVDVKHVFSFVKQALTVPLDPGSVVVSLSSGAALRGSPLSGGYSGAKSTIKTISGYAGLDAQRHGSGVRFVAVLPLLTPATDLGRVYTEAYASQAGVTEAQFLEGMGGELSTAQAATSIADLAANDSFTAPAYLLAATGLQPLT